MAARENQGLQIALIIFVMLTIVLIVTSYMFFRNYSDERDKAKSLTQQNSDKDAKMRQAIAETDDIKNVIGVAPTETIDAVKESSKKEMQTYGEGLPATKQNYRALIEHLVAKLRKLEETNGQLTSQVKELNDKLKSNDEAAKAEVAKYSAQLAQTAADMKKERQTFGENRSQITQEKDQLKTRFETTQQEHVKLVQKSTEQVSALTGRLMRTEQLLTDVRTKEDSEKKANEFPDGKITRVNQRTRQVYLNVGAADGLRRQTSFVIVAPEDGNPIKSKPKGTIEVVNLSGAHQAEARIVDDDLSNPIMPGDNIFSVAWQAGRPERFALAGNMDIDGDGESDRKRVRDLISVNGGAIDAEVADDGTRTGQMSIDTKYLVMGKAPEADGKNLEGYSNIKTEAETLGVNIIPLNEFLDYMGFKDEQRTVNLGRFAKPGDFKPRLPGGVQRVMPGSETRKELRKPRGASQAVPY